MRVAILRTGIVLGRGGGFLGSVAPLFRAGVGGALGSGDQRVSWIFAFRKQAVRLRFGTSAHP